MVVPSMTEQLSRARHRKALRSSAADTGRRRRLALVLVLLAALPFSASPFFQNQASANSSLEEEKVSAEIEKLKAENKKLQDEAVPPLLRQIVLAAPALTPLAAVAALLTVVFSVFSWIKTRKSDQDKRQIEHLHMLLVRLGHDHGSTRATAAIGLKSYLGVSPPHAFQYEVIESLVTALGLEKDLIVKKKIAEILQKAGHAADDELLKLQQRLRETINPMFDGLQAAGSDEAVAGMQRDIRSLQASYLLSAVILSENGKQPCRLAQAPFRSFKLIEEATQLKGADFSSAFLARADFYNSNLTDCDFSNADLSRASFAKANLVGARFEGSNVDAADFSSARNFQRSLLEGARNRALAKLPVDCVPFD
jgi:hypothetical protein